MKKTVTINRLFALFTLLINTIYFQSCKENNPVPVIKPGDVGFYIVNEGGFGSRNTSISFYDRKTDEVTNNIIFTKDHEAGDQTQSMTVFEGKAYIVVQGSAKVEVIDNTNFSFIATITENLSSPRYFIGVSATKGYVTDWGSDRLTGTVNVIDLTTFKVIKSIPTGLGSNKMIKVGNLVYVTNKGGFDSPKNVGVKDNTVKIIDINTDAIIASVTTGDNPNSLQVDKEGNIWVTCSGLSVYKSDWSLDEVNSTKGSISKINTAHQEVFRLLVDKLSTPDNLCISPDGKTVYYTYNSGVYSMSIYSTTLPTTPLIKKEFYGLDIDPINGNILGGYAPNFTASGSLDIHDSAGEFKKSYPVGIAPNGFAFK